MVPEVCDGRSTLFWRDRWLMGQRLEDLASHVHALVPFRIVAPRLWLVLAPGAVSQRAFGRLTGFVFLPLPPLLPALMLLLPLRLHPSRSGIIDLVTSVALACLP